MDSQTLQPKRKLPLKRGLMGAALAASVAGAGLLASLPAGAQDNQQPAAEAEAPATEFDPRVVEQGFRIWKTKIVCGECHGWSGNGVPDNPRQPVGANLRETTLTHDQLVEIIKCGIPGTGMPHFDQRAYKDDRCYGVTAEDLGDQTPPGWGAYLIPREIEAVATYIEAKQKGRGPFTFEDCEEYFGDGAQICVTYESNRGAQAPVSQAPAQDGRPH